MTHLFSRRRWPALALAAACTALPQLAHAHGVVGDRFFPATIATDDPFAADELALPTIGLGNHEEDYDFEWSKTIFEHVAISFAGGYVNAHPPGGLNASGFDNFEITPAWQFITDADSEFVATAAMSFEIGGSGSHAVADTFTTYTPTLLIGKGFGDLPDSMALLRPLAATATIGYAIPGTSTESKTLEWGGALEYSLLYLQTNVRDQGFSNFVAHLTPLVEFSLETPTDAGGSGTTGTVNPGLIWSGQYIQLGVEAAIPVNHASGDNVGVLMQLHFYIDDIFPDSLGTPLFGGK
ncbi:MAG TPA: hypothetical protein VHZ78_08390 [Rhizomicrobium sp.]|jgi:hypothetical protein|nr:hypothetical protein [Rhizomicrobium sp.]